MCIPTFHVNPQFYAFRWITLLLMQEIKFHDFMNLWSHGANYYLPWIILKFVNFWPIVSCHESLGNKTYMFFMAPDILKKLCECKDIDETAEALQHHVYVDWSAEWSTRFYAFFSFSFRLQVAYLFILLGFKLLICWLVYRMLDKKDNQLFQETTTNVQMDFSNTENHQQHC
jgi:hypothetical protein